MTVLKYLSACGNWKRNYAPLSIACWSGCFDKKKNVLTFVPKMIYSNIWGECVYIELKYWQIFIFVIVNLLHHLHKIRNTKILQTLQLAMSTLALMELHN